MLQGLTGYVIFARPLLHEQPRLRDLLMYQKKTLCRHWDWIHNPWNVILRLHWLRNLDLLRMTIENVLRFTWLIFSLSFPDYYDNICHTFSATTAVIWVILWIEVRHYLWGDLSVACSLKVFAKTPSDHSWDIGSNLPYSCPIVIAFGLMMAYRT